MQTGPNLQPDKPYRGTKVLNQETGRIIKTRNSLLKPADLKPLQFLAKKGLTCWHRYINLKTARFGLQVHNNIHKSHDFSKLF